MIVCSCRGVSDRTLLQAIRDGANTVDEVGQRTGAGTGCGCCRGSLAQIIDRTLATTATVDPCSGGCASCPNRQSEAA